MTSGSRKPWRWSVPGVLLLVAAAVILPPLINIGRYQRKIAASIAGSIGRPVHLSSVSLRLLPLPAFELSDFSVEERAEFGNEPILHADSVVAYPRLISLWRGRLEIARIHFDNASLNLVRAPNGSWNFASILVQAAHSPVAPTGQLHAGASPRFPYIEATNSRINFKVGNEKTPLSFLNSDLSIWLDHPDEWGVHFRAQPVRTDLDLVLSDTGTLRIDGTLRRAATLAAVPINLHAEWSAAPLGQLSRLAIGDDAGWRGDVDLQADFTGTAGFANITTLLKIDELHRAEFTPAQPLSLNTLCRAAYRNASASVEDLTCTSAIDSGSLTLHGNLHNLQSKADIDLALKIDRVPSSAVLSALAELREDLGTDTRASGTLNGAFHYLSAPGRPPLLSGEMGMDSLTLVPPDSKPLILAPIRLVAERQDGTAADGSALAAPPPALLLQPIRLALGSPTPLAVDGRFTLGAFDLHLNGSGSLARLHGLSKAFAWVSASTNHDSPAKLGAMGSATVDLNVRGPWLLPIKDPDDPIATSVTVGSVSLKDAELVEPYLSQPVKIASAQGTLSPTGIAWTNASIEYGTLQAQGSLDYPTTCVPDGPCSGRFQLVSSALDVGELQSALLGSPQRGELLREILDRIEQRPANWPALSGTAEIGTLSLGKLVLHDAHADLDISGKSMKIRSLNGGLLNGVAHLSGNVDASGDQPEYKMEAQVTGVSPSSLGTLFGERWGNGTADFSLQLLSSGFAARDLADSATGTLHWNWSKGSLAPQDASAGPAQSLLRFDNWSGEASIADNGLEIEHSSLTRGTMAIPLSGTVSFDRNLNLHGGAGSHPFWITGDFAHPRIRLLAK